MNFQSLKIMVDSLVKTFYCPECNSKIADDSIEIMGTAGQNINIDIQCPKCQKHSMIQAQMVAMNLPIKEIEIQAKEIDKKITENMQKKLDKIEKFKGHIEDMKTKSDVIDTNSIKDSSIIELNKNLKSNNISMSELFGE